MKNSTIAIILFTPALLFVSYACIRNLKLHEVCLLEEKIVSVGGCNKYGDCGARTSSGRRVVRLLPVVGVMTCVKKEWR